MVKDWFGSRFGDLHPLLQELHTLGGTLHGDVYIVYGGGLAGVIGRRIAKKLNVPGAGRHKFMVRISHHSDGLHWDRTFDDTTDMRSVFTPVGAIDDGYWIEQTGPLKLRLTVDIEKGGWYWRCLGFQLWGVPLPVWLFPNSRAYKTIEDGQYRFYVGFSLPLLGPLLSYSGLLRADDTPRTLNNRSR